MTGAERRLPAPIEDAAFGIIQESLNNVVKHANARAGAGAGSVRHRRAARVDHDNGVGFDPSAPRAARTLGMSSMRERAEGVGGRLGGRECPGPGTPCRGRPADPTMPTSPDVRPIRVLIVDDHGMVREGLRAYLELEPDIQVVGEARDGQEGVRRAPGAPPDVVLMDLVMPNMDGVDATTRIKQQQPDTHVIILTSFLDDERVVPAIKAGATSYLLKDVAATDLARAIRGARAGQAQLHPEVARTADAAGHLAAQARGRRAADRPRTRSPAPAGRRPQQQRDRPRRWSSANAPSKATSRTSSASWACKTAPRPPCSPSATASPPSR